MSLQLGAPAPQFSLQNQDGKTVSLGDFKGKTVVVYFYPKALTPGCTDQACGLRDVKADLQAHNTIVLGLSPDPVAKLAKFRDKHGLNFDLLSDEDHAVAEAFGVWQLKKFMGKEYMGVVRTTFIIDAEGNLSQVLDKFKTKTHHETLLSVLAG
jgi:peroxiredoxin Q/BCP